MSGAKQVVAPPPDRAASGGPKETAPDEGISRTASAPGAPTYTAEEQRQLKAIDEKLWKQIMNEVVQQGAEVLCPAFHVSQPSEVF